MAKIATPPRKYLLPALKLCPPDERRQMKNQAKASFMDCSTAAAEEACWTIDGCDRILFASSSLRSSAEGRNNLEGDREQEKRESENGERD